ncbi:MAG: Mov34/MPN/PAD-1 family protein [Methanobacteriaceae archaeon]|nr:Mov34/MPN/PAD-1 family protein [Methanobacteriaceae archaeon]
MGFFSKIFSSDNKKFNEVKVDKEVIESFLYYANKSFPNEFLALLEGKIKDKTLYIIGLIFVPGETSDTGAVLQTGMLPSNIDSWGSIHSHPGPSAQPSGADLLTFSKNGVFHMIVCLPYSFETIKAYDKYGEPVDFNIGYYKQLFSEDELNDELFDDDLDEDLFDDEDIDFDDEENDELIPQNPNFISPEQISSKEIIIDAKDLEDSGVINIEIDEFGNVKKINNKDIDDKNKK